MLRFWIYRQRRLLTFLALVFLGSLSIWSVEQFNHDLSFLLGNRRPTTDVSKLEQFLKTKKWEAADRETSKLILEATDTPSDLSEIEPSLVKRLPCADLQAIDQLWVKYSQGRFGFSVQKRIFEAIAKAPAPKAVEASAPNHNKKLSSEKNLNLVSEPRSSDADQQKIWQMNQFTGRVGLGLRQSTKPTLKAPPGRLPSWGVFFEQQPTDNFKPFSTPEFVQRQKWCRLS